MSFSFSRYDCLDCHQICLMTVNLYVREGHKSNACGSDSDIDYVLQQDTSLDSDENCLLPLSVYSNGKPMVLVNSCGESKILGGVLRSVFLTWNPLPSLQKSITACSNTNFMSSSRAQTGKHFSYICLFCTCLHIFLEAYIVSFIINSTVYLFFCFQVQLQYSNSPSPHEVNTIFTVLLLLLLNSKPSRRTSGCGTPSKLGSCFHK